MSQHLLSILIWLPIFGGFALLAIGDAGDHKSARAAMMRNVALAISAVTFILSTGLYTGFDNAATGMQFVERMEWIASLGVHYYLGVDGISAPLILLTTFITPLVVIAGWDTIKARPAQYFAAFLILEGLMIGVFAALDGILFYVFWEFMLVPMFLIIGVWGGANRIYATLKFFLYTFLGSVLMLVAFVYLYRQTGSFDLFGWMDAPLSMTAQKMIFIAFLVAFAVKVPMWPVHTWLPDAHVEAPTGGSVILAAIMLKMGGYGFIRLSLPIVPGRQRVLLRPDDRLVAHRGCLHRPRRADAKGHEEAHRLFIDCAHGLRHAWLLPAVVDRRPDRRGAGHAGRHGADDLARRYLRCHVPLCWRPVRPHA